MEIESKTRAGHKINDNTRLIRTHFAREETHAQQGEMGVATDRFRAHCLHRGLVAGISDDRVDAHQPRILERLLELGL